MRKPTPLRAGTTRREALAALAGVSILRAAPEKAGVFRGIEVNHVALRVSDVSRSEEFYRGMFGAPGIIFERPGQRYLRLGTNFIALFEGGEAAMDHFAVSVEGYDPDAVEKRTKELGLQTRRSNGFVYVHDPDGIEVQIAHAEHEVHSPVVRERPESSTFRGAGVNHVALRVTDIGRSRDFYRDLFGMPVVSESASNCFLGLGDNFVALFRGDEPGMDHFCVSIENYEAAAAVETLQRIGLEPRREANRVYFPDPNGLTVQLSARGHRP